jgi:hypothetical protein
MPTDLREATEKSESDEEAATISRRSFILSYELKHDFHHGGEISLTLEMDGLASPE